VRPNRHSEEAVCRAWEAGLVASPVVRAADGRRLVVLFPGRRHRGAGPDFRDARFATEAGEILTGDLEVHRYAADWFAHGHDTDPAYCSVRFHLVTRPGTLSPPGDGRLITLAFEPGTVPLPGWGEPCRGAARRMAPEGLRAILRAAGEARFAGKVIRARVLIVLFGREEALYRLVGRALGYGLPGPGFGLLGLRVSWAQLRAELADLPEDQRYDRAHRVLAAGLGRTPQGPTGPVRPANRIQVRLGQLASLLSWAVEPGLWSLFEGLVSRPDPIRSTVGALRAWAPGLGVERARVVAVNAVLPAFGAWASLAGDDGTISRVRAAWATAPGLGSNFVTRYLLDQVWGLTGPVWGAEHQGCLHLYETLCRPGRCGECPVGEGLRRIL
jgi:hypothetical protein